MQLIDTSHNAFALILLGGATLWRLIGVPLKITIVGLLIATPQVRLTIPPGLSHLRKR